MTITKFTLSHLAALLFSLSSMVASSAATTYPLNSPQGLALDSKGNLYVANNSGDRVLVYDTSYQQVSSKTITHDVVNPNGLAFDPSLVRVASLKSLVGRDISAKGEGEAFSKATAQPIGWFAESRQYCACGRRLSRRRMVLVLGDALLAIVIAATIVGQHEYAKVAHHKK